MNLSYEMKGCVSFEGSDLVFSVPILTDRGSNRVFIPKTDNHFNVLDFYEMEDIEYPIHWLHPKQFESVRIGNKCPVPLMVGGTAFIINPADDAHAIRQEHPTLNDSAVKAFVSLRERMRLAAQDMPLEDWHTIHRFPEELIRPVRSRYWISKFAAHVRSVHEDKTTINPAWIESANSARNKWIDMFAHKAPFRMIKDLFDVHELPMSKLEQDRVFITRFDNLFRAKWFNIESPEISGYEARFPQGIINAAKSFDEGASYTAWNMQAEYSRIIDSHCRNLRARYAPDTGDSVWNLSFLDLTRILRVIKLLAADEFYFEDALYPLKDIFHSGTNSLMTMLNALDGILKPEKRTNRKLDLLAISLFGAGAGFPYEEDYFSVKFGEMLHDYHRKLLMLYQIINPHLRLLKLREIAIEGIDPQLFWDDGKDKHLLSF